MQIPKRMQNQPKTNPVPTSTRLVAFNAWLGIHDQAPGSETNRTQGRGGPAKTASTKAGPETVWGLCGGAPGGTRVGVGFCKCLNQVLGAARKHCFCTFFLLIVLLLRCVWFLNMPHNAKQRDHIFGSLVSVFVHASVRGPGGNKDFRVFVRHIMCVS